MNGSLIVLVLKTEKPGKRERKALFPSQKKGHDDDDEAIDHQTDNTVRKLDNKV